MTGDTDRRPAVLTLLLLLIMAIVLGLGMALGRVVPAQDPVRVYGWAMAAVVFGVLVGLTEIFTRYRDEPVLASLTSAGLAYLLFNGLIALAAYLVLLAYADAIFPRIKGDLFLTATVAGFGAMTIFRAKLFTYKSSDGKEYSIGPAIVLETVLRTVDQKIDRRRATLRQRRTYERTARLVEYEPMAQYIEATLGSFQNLSVDDKAQIAQVTADYRKAPYPDRLKILGLAFGFLNVAGEENFDLVLENIAAYIEALGIEGVRAVNITATTADIVWLTTAPADSQVEYGLDGNYGSAVPAAGPNPVAAVLHQENLTGLATKTLHHYRVKSQTPTRQMTSADYTFTTL